MSENKLQKANPKTKEEWDEFWEKNKILAEKIKKAGDSYITLSNEEFKNFIADMSTADKKVFMQKMRSTLQFYKKIVSEPYYEKNKKGDRYYDAFRKYELINEKGKLISQIIKKEENE
jgi:hypothetical protein